MPCQAPIPVLFSFILSRCQQVLQQEASWLPQWDRTTPPGQAFDLEGLLQISDVAGTMTSAQMATTPLAAPLQATGTLGLAGSALLVMMAAGPFQGD